jgi:hypothetical protein
MPILQQSIARPACPSASPAVFPVEIASLAQADTTLFDCQLVPTTVWGAAHPATTNRVVTARPVSSPAPPAPQLQPASLASQAPTSTRLLMGVSWPALLMHTSTL